MTTATDAPLKAVELTAEELGEIEEGTRCSSNLMCRGLLIGNTPAHLGWYLTDDGDGWDRARCGYTWRFPHRPDDLYCEDCTIQIEADDAECRPIADPATPTPMFGTHEHAGI